MCALESMFFSRGNNQNLSTEYEKVKYSNILNNSSNNVNRYFDNCGFNNLLNIINNHVTTYNDNIINNKIFLKIKDLELTNSSNPHILINHLENLINTNDQTIEIIGNFIKNNIDAIIPTALNINDDIEQIIKPYEELTTLLKNKTNVDINFCQTIRNLYNELEISECQKKLTSTFDINCVKKLYIAGKLNRTQLCNSIKTVITEDNLKQILLDIMNITNNNPICMYETFSAFISICPDYILLFEEYKFSQPELFLIKKNILNDYSDRHSGAVNNLGFNVCKFSKMQNIFNSMLKEVTTILKLNSNLTENFDDNSTNLSNQSLE